MDMLGSNMTPPDTLAVLSERLDGHIAQNDKDHRNLAESTGRIGADMTTLTKDHQATATQVALHDEALRQLTGRPASVATWVALGAAVLTAAGALGAQWFRPPPAKEDIAQEVVAALAKSGRLR